MNEFGWFHLLIRVITGTVLNLFIKFKQIQTDHLGSFIPKNRKLNALIHFEDAPYYKFNLQSNFTRKTVLRIFLKFSSNLLYRNSEF